MDYIVNIEYQSVCPFVGTGWVRGRGEPNSDDWTESLALCILCAPLTCSKRAACNHDYGYYSCVMLELLLNVWRCMSGY